MKYLLAGSVALAMYVAVMIGGGMLYIDDKQEAYTRDTW
jgi:ABC-2 type transport system permease protein